jgi:cytochrome c oxidase subunit 2
MPANGAAHGAAFDHEMVLSLAIVGALMIIAKAILVVSALSPARERAAESRVNFFGLGTLVFLTVVFAWLLIRAERMWAQQRFTGADPTAMQVEVVGEQFVWYFRYPGPDATFGTTRPELVDAAAGNPLGLDRRDSHAADDRVTSELVLPVGREVDVRLHAFDVIHGFFIPGMRVKQNALPGSTLHIHFTPSVIGEYPIVCSQVCGLGHYRMQAQLRVVSEADYERWLAGRAK